MALGVEVDWRANRQFRRKIKVITEKVRHLQAGYVRYIIMRWSDEKSNAHDAHVFEGRCKNLLSSVHRLISRHEISSPRENYFSSTSGGIDRVVRTMRSRVTPEFRNSGRIRHLT